MSLTKLAIKEGLKEISFYSNVNKIELYVTKIGKSLVEKTQVGKFM